MFIPKKLTLFIAFAFLFSCSLSLKKNRDPQAFLKNYDPIKIALLKSAADNRLLFQIPDQTFKDFNTLEVGDKCRKQIEPFWPKAVYFLLEVLNQNPQLYAKIHSVEIKRGDRPNLEINKDLDGGTTMVLLYSKTESHKTIQSLMDIPCSSQSLDLIGKDLVEVSFSIPDAKEIIEKLSLLPNKLAIERFNFNTTFLHFLASRQSLLRFTPELAFEKTSEGQPLIVELFNDLSTSIKPDSNFESLDYWLRDISLNSKHSDKLKLFSIRRDSDLSYGLETGTESEIQRKINGTTSPTMAYLSYKIETDKFLHVSLDKLESCLSKIPRTNHFLSRDSYSYLHPGFHCK